jgi:site-specific DNA recombinase
VRDVGAPDGTGLVYGKAAYRCRHGHTGAAAPDPGRPKNAYVREDRAPACYRLPLLLVMVPLVSGVPEHKGSW